MRWMKLKHWYWCEACGWMDKQGNHQEEPKLCPRCSKPPTDTTGFGGDISCAAATAGSSAEPTTITSRAEELSESDLET